ncbi:MAG: Flavoredoxin [Promethearchaeota archaeon]|nr:MAG: Flavoredoxin [Candidatus Lokiarchaeota archaeon]
MIKQKITISSNLFPSPVVLIGVKSETKPNFFLVADIMLSQYKPLLVLFSCYKKHYSTPILIENKCFSLNIPSEDMVAKADYCGIGSGKNTDKSNVFSVFYGENIKAPLIEEAPINAVCELRKTVDMNGTHYIFIAEITEMYAEDEILTKGRPDYQKVKPYIYTKDNTYRQMGSIIGKAYKEGKVYK